MLLISMSVRVLARDTGSVGFIWQHLAYPPELATGTPIVHLGRVRIVLA
jgi:hypothetical protein